MSRRKGTHHVFLTVRVTGGNLHLLLVCRAALTLVKECEALERDQRRVDFFNIHGHGIYRVL